MLTQRDYRIRQSIVAKDWSSDFHIQKFLIGAGNGISPTPTGRLITERTAVPLAIPDEFLLCAHPPICRFRIRSFFCKASDRKIDEKETPKGKISIGRCILW
jgi:hypothetical protein